ncbi:hypothetical protein [Halorientalis litorea]|jgi:hypothetical protein|uniref:hypothetical protein n=1 Tax=Halorientalis litorea TaxID=2931977 RepID=UPI001FF2433C|nr:hypothetical protein [Halorientalis litorea]
MDEEDEVEVEQLNTRAAAGLVVSVVVGIVGLFLLPSLRSLGVSFGVAFWSLLALEFAAFLGVFASVRRLHQPLE